MDLPDHTGCSLVDPFLVIPSCTPDIPKPITFKSIVDVRLHSQPISRICPLSSLRGIHGPELWARINRGCQFKCRYLQRNVVMAPGFIPARGSWCIVRRLSYKVLDFWTYVRQRSTFVLGHISMQSHTCFCRYWADHNFVHVITSDFCFISLPSSLPESHISLIRGIRDLFKVVPHQSIHNQKLRTGPF